MISLPGIRHLFKPVQPTVQHPGQVSYRELLPDDRLLSFIHCYWELKTKEPLTDPFFYRVVADGCIDIFVETSQPDAHYIMGFSGSYTSFPLPDSFLYRGIRFLPAAFPFLYRIHAADLTDRFEELKDVVPSLSEALSRLQSPDQSFADCSKAWNHYFLEVIASSALSVDNRFFDAMQQILLSQGTLNVEKDITTGISPRQLRRMFHQYIGDSPKMFSKVVRFQHILHAKPSVESLRKNKLFFDAGYYDQAHFIKEFKTLFGATPASAFRP